MTETYAPEVNGPANFERNLAVWIALAIESGITVGIFARNFVTTNAKSKNASANLFKLNSGTALAPVGDVLIEVPIVPSPEAFSNPTRNRFSKALV